MKAMRKLKRWMAALLVAILVLAPAIPMNVSAAGSTYPTVDMFKNSSIKGLQGATSSTLYGGVDHTVVSIFLDDMIKDPNGPWATNGWMAPYAFEGEQYYFENDIRGKMGQVVRANEQGMSVSVVFLLRKRADQYGSDSSFLIDQGSLADGHLYYAPNADLNTYGGRAIRAYWHFLMERLSEEGCHIDNFILGNEVNMPNQWHYSGSTDGSGDADNCVRKYADAFYYMYSAVRKYTDVSRCSISLDHSWQNDNEGKGIAAKDFLHRFNDRLAQHGGNVDWCVSTHLYPAQLYAPDIWNDPHNLAPNDSSARIIDGSNLSVMTNYIRDTFGSEHRIMLTEQGFSDECGEQVQAASLAYSYYAAKYDPMVDSFAINIENAGTADGKSLNFDITGKLAEEVYTKIDNGNEADQQWIASVCLPVIGVGSWAEIIPNFGQEPTPLPEPTPEPEPEPEPDPEPIPLPEVSPEVKAQVEAFVERMYTVALGRDAEAEGLEYWVYMLLTQQNDGANLAQGFILTSAEFQNKNYSNEEYIRILYRTFFDRDATLDPSGFAYWQGIMEAGNSRACVLAGFVNSVEFDSLCREYGISRGYMREDGNVINPGIWRFSERLYTKILERGSEKDGIEYWTRMIADGVATPEAAAKEFFRSPEYLDKQTSNDQYVETLYQTFMDRASDSSGKANWLEHLNNGASREFVLEGFASSNEFKSIMARYGL